MAKFNEQLWTFLGILAKMVHFDKKKAIYIKCAKILRSITGAADIYPAKCEKGDFEESWLSIDLVSPKPFLDWGLVSLLSSLGFMITLANIAIKSLKFLGWKKDGSST